MGIGISKDEVVRIGGKSTDRIAPLSLQVLGRRVGYRLNRWDWDEINELRETRADSIEALQRAYRACSVGYKEIMEYLEDQHQEYATAFLVPESKNDATTPTDANGVDAMGVDASGADASGADASGVDAKGKIVDPYHLLDQWYLGQDAGALKTADNVKASDGIWKMGRPSRLTLFNAWRRAAMKKSVAELVQVGQKYNRCVTDLGAMYRKGEASVLEDRRVIGCTTTGAAIYRSAKKFLSVPLSTNSRAGNKLKLPALLCF